MLTLLLSVHEHTQTRRMATRGIEAGPVLTDDRIKALKTHIHALLKMLKKAYDEAKMEGAAEQLRVDADRCVQQFQDASSDAA